MTCFPPVEPPPKPPLLRLQQPLLRRTMPLVTLSSPTPPHLPGGGVFHAAPAMGSAAIGREGGGVPGFCDARPMPASTRQAREGMSRHTAGNRILARSAILPSSASFIPRPASTSSRIGPFSRIRPVEDQRVSKKGLHYSGGWSQGDGVELGAGLGYRGSARTCRRSM